MKYRVLLTETNGGFRATVAGLPDCKATAQTRNETLDTIRNAISNFIGRSEVVEIDVPQKPKTGDLRSTTPWEWFGAFKNDPTWSAVFDDIEKTRNSK